MKRFTLLLLLGAGFLLGCRGLYYSAWEKLGKEKRDLLQTKVKQVRDGQTEAVQQLSDALTRLQAMYNIQGGELAAAYKRLQGDYDKSVERANAVRGRISQMDQIARDLFAEWEKEANTITTPALRENSLTQLGETRTRFDALYSATSRAEKSIEPVLTKFHDYVLSLKHSLNAQAISALQGEAGRIQADVSQLIADMNTSIKEADVFLQSTK